MTILELDSTAVVTVPGLHYQRFYGSEGASGAVTLVGVQPFLRLHELIGTSTPLWFWEGQRCFRSGGPPPTATFTHALTYTSLGLRASDSVVSLPVSLSLPGQPATDHDCKFGDLDLENTIVRLKPWHWC